MPSLKLLKQIAPMIKGEDADIEIAATLFLNNSSPKVKFRLLKNYLYGEYPLTNPECGVLYNNMPSGHILKFKSKLESLLLEEVEENFYKISKNK